MFPEILWIVPFVPLLLKGRDRRAPDLGERLDDHGAGIRCPSCKWRPSKTDLWGCFPGCGYSWNTFQTRGECPSCGKKWAKTQCRKCGVWHDHDAWYEQV